MLNKSKNSADDSSFSEVQHIPVNGEYEGQRIDNFLVTLLKGVPRTHIYRIIRKGEIRVNKGRVKQTYRLQAGDLIRIPPIRTSNAKSNPNASKGVLQLIQNSIIYEDNALIVLNKPSGLAVHGGSGLNYGVIEGLRIIYPQEKRLELVHRIDRDTSGCLLVAKKASVLKSIQQAMMNDEVEKNYLALLKGKLHQSEILVNAPLKKNVTRSGERIVVVDEEGKASETMIFPEHVYSQATLVNIRLLTGRTHQIRVHSMHLGHPVAGDEKYGDKIFNKTMEALGLKRLFLHAKSLRLVHPLSGDELNFEAPLDGQLIKVLNNLKNESL